jgi:hypothetical protein
MPKLQVQREQQLAAQPERQQLEQLAVQQEVQPAQQQAVQLVLEFQQAQVRQQGLRQLALMLQIRYQLQQELHQPERYRPLEPKFAR